MRWKNIGVWLVVIFVSLTTFSVGRIRYKLVVLNIDKDDPSIDKYVILSLVFGGCSMFCQVIACLIMLTATVTMDKMRRKNGFDSSQFQDIKMNFLVSLFICIGYGFDYGSDVTTTILLIEEVISFE